MVCDETPTKLDLLIKCVLETMVDLPMKMIKMIDLHTHSSISDGTDSPEQLLDLAVNQGISTIALCDHDTTAGLHRFISYASGLPLNAIPGIELSAEWKKGNCHILGLNLDLQNEYFEKTLCELRSGRDIRNVQICKKLMDLGIKVSIEEVMEFAKGEVVARPHIAMVLIKKGYCNSIDEAFDRFLAKGAPAYVERFRLKPADAVRMLKKIGSRVFLAHPTQLKLTSDELKTFVISLTEYGLDGLEVYTPYTSDEEISCYSTICKELGLKASGGSDYHGKSKPDHHLGYYRSDRKIPEYVIKAVD